MLLILGLAPGLSKAATLEERLQGPRVAAHQGGLFRSDPDTLAAFESARRMGADIVEMDLHLTQDGVPVIFHDETLDRWTSCRGPVSGLSFAQLRRCRYTFTSEPIASFEEVLKWAAGRIVINAEFKERAVIAAAVALVKKYGAEEWVYFQCKADPRRYEAARAGDGRVALLFAPKNAAQLDWALGLKDARLLVIELHEALRSAETVERIHAAGKFATEDSWHYVRTAETLGAACDKVFDLGIDIAVSNRPEGCVRQRDERRPRAAP